MLRVLSGIYDHNMLQYNTLFCMCVCVCVDSARLRSLYKTDPIEVGMTHA